MDFSALNFALGAGTAMVVALVGIANQRKVSNEQYQSSKQEWSDIALMKEEHIKELERKVEGLEDRSKEKDMRLAQIETEATAYRRERDLWARRNAAQYEAIQEYRARLKRYGENTPEPENGSP